MSSSNFDAEILAAQQVKNALIKKVGLFSAVAVASATAIYFGASFIASQPSTSDSSAPIQTVQDAAETSENFLQVAREELQQKLVFAENAVADIEQDTGRNNFNANAITPLRNTLKLALGSYSSENYQQAAKQLEQLKTAVTAFEQDYAQAWQNAWQQAQTAFEQAQQNQDAEAITQAQLHNQRVLHINPNFSPALDLQSRLDVWRDVQQQLEQLRVAEVENNLEKQLRLSQSIVQLDPSNQAMAQNVARLQETIKEQRFAQMIVTARSALASGDTATAQEALQKARAIDGNRAEVSELQKELDRIAKNNSLARFEQQIATMQSADNWAAAQRLSAAAKAKHPEHANFELSLQLAGQVLNYQQRLNTYLSAPERLADSNIHNNAQRLLAEVSPFEVASAGLKSSADSLRLALEDSQQTMSVTVLSDGRTDIRVLGTGVVGKTREKVIQLLPGSYRFEGRREGYQSKIVSFTVLATDEVQTITLICDEKI